MLCESVLGNLSEEKFNGLRVDYVDVEWHDCFKKIHRLETASGEEVGLRLDNEVLKVGLKQDDVLYCDEERAVAVNIPPCEVVVVKAEHPCLVAKICYEIGNRHATLFYGENELEFVTPYNEPMLEMLSKIHRHMGGECYRAVAEKKVMKLDFKKAISSSINNHTH